MPLSVQVRHTGITVADLDRSLAFWCDALGFEVLSRSTASGPAVGAVPGVPGAKIEIAMVRGGGHTVELLQYIEPGDRQTVRPRSCDVGSWHLALFVEDMDAALAALADHGFQPLNPPVVMETGAQAGRKSVYARDSDGTTIELTQPGPTEPLT